MHRSNKEYKNTCKKTRI